MPTRPDRTRSHILATAALGFALLVSVASMATADTLIPDHDIYEIGFPIRADDLKPFHYAVISDDSNGWHDMHIRRFDRKTAQWTTNRPGGSGETEAVGWNIPIYAGVDGQVISCWRNSPYNVAFQPETQQLGGNFLIIRTSDDHYVYYAHMGTDTIPSEICPNESPTGLYDDPQNKFPGSNIPLESYILEDQRPYVESGQFIGRMGAHGNAAGVHLHVHVGHVRENQEGVVSTIDVIHHVGFNDVWYQNLESVPDPDGWVLARGSAIPEAALASDLLIWPSYKHESTSAATPRLTNYKLNPMDDLLCHDTSTGGIFVDYASVDLLVGTDWRSGTTWCNASTQRLHKGDFNGDGRADLLCHDVDQGMLWIDYADALGRFSGTDFYRAAPWCFAGGQTLYVGDFNGDALDDLLCHDFETGDKWVDYYQPDSEFSGTDASSSSSWCYRYYQELHIGDFNGDGRADLLCHELITGDLYIDYSSGDFGLSGTDWKGSPWCYTGGQRLFVGAFDSNSTDDLLCHDSDGGRMYLDYADLSGRFEGTDWSDGPNGWCTGPEERLFTGDVDGNDADDLICHDRVSGMRWVDFMQPGDPFSGADWAATAAWCYLPTQTLH